MSDLGDMAASAIMGFIIISVLGGVVAGGLLVLGGVYLIPWIHSHLSIIWG